MREAAAERGWIRKTAWLTAKDLRVEFRALDTLPPMVAFSFAVTLLLAFTLPASSRVSAPISLPIGNTVALVEVLAGFFWITILFAGLIGFARTFEIERSEGAIDALLLVPLDRSGLFLSKAIANLMFIVAVECFTLPAFALLFGLQLGSSWGGLVIVTVLVDVGFVALGTLFAALAAQTRSRELMLPILALPALVPLFIAATELTSDLFAGGGFEVLAERGWFGLLIGFDVIFGLISALTFEFIID